MSTVAVKWMEEKSRLFACLDSFGNTVMSGAPSGDGIELQEWRAAKPTDLLLMGLAACTAHEVVSILERQRQALTALHIDVDGRQQPAPPFAFTAIHLRFTLAGLDLDPGRVARALDLSLNKYCSVAATIRGVATITHEFVIEN